jgi:hypothetical protein
VSLDIRDVKELLDERLKPLLDTGSNYEKYQVERMDYSERKQRWYVQIGKMIDLDNNRKTLDELS